jgi:hypothetical protein
MIAPNVKEPVVKTINGITGLFYNYRDHDGASRWKIETKCPVCGKVYWLKEPSIRTGKTKMCYKCAISRLKAKGKDHLGYKNGRVKKPSGYINVLLNENDPLISMSIDGNYVAEHRYVVAKKLGRPLKESEHVHHLNGKKDDNRIENLKLLDGNIHQIVTCLEQKIKRLEKENKKLKNKLKKGGAT